MTDREYMERAIELAKGGIGHVDPNPLVGAVIVKDGRIIGEGFHEIYGQEHAERNAIKKLTEDAEGATIYVTLEPCCHYGKQPPCTEAIVEAGINKVFIGSRDPNPLVHGKGAAYLREHGIEVVEDFLKEECDTLNPVFFHFITTQMPYVVLKYAMTADGKIATKSGASKWISNEKSRQEAHCMRGRYTGIMAGIGTVLADNPMLDTRIEGMRDPVRIICDTRLSIPMDSKLVNTAADKRLIIAASLSMKASKKADELEKKGAGIIFLPEKNGHIELRTLMEKLGSLKINSILVEGGGILNEALFAENLVNEVNVFVAPKVFGGSGAKSPVEGNGVSEVDEACHLKLISTKLIDDDILLTYRRV